MAAACPCGSGSPFGDCCRPILREEREPATAEALMRSRYTAYVRRDEEHLLRTWDASTRPAALDLQDVAWRGLDVHATSDGGEDDAEGTITFTAYWAQGTGTLAPMTEVSRFVRDSGRWRYLDGTVS